MSKSGVAWRFIYEPADRIVDYQTDGKSKSSSLVVPRYHLMLSSSGRILVRAWWRDAQNIWLFDRANDTRKTAA
jgi:hypothetical protein